MINHIVQLNLKENLITRSLKYAISAHSMIVLLVFIQEYFCHYNVTFILSKMITQVSHRTVRKETFALGFDLGTF